LLLPEELLLVFFDPLFDVSAQEPHSVYLLDAFFEGVVDLLVFVHVAIEAIRVDTAVN